MITIGIIAITALISLLAFGNAQLFDKLCLNPYLMHRDKTQYHRIFTVAFVHASPGHLFFNMLTLFFFGRELEGKVFSELQYLLLYASAIVLSCADEYARQKNNPDYKACGASGAVAAIMFALALFAPWGVVYIKFIIPVYFILFAVGYLIYSYYMQGKGTDNIAHGIHLWGALYGIAFTLLVKPESFSLFLESIRNPPFLH